MARAPRSADAPPARRKRTAAVTAQTAKAAEAGAAAETAQAARPPGGTATVADAPPVASTVPVAKPSGAASNASGFDLSGYETVALVLQGGGALGAYQAGVYEGLAEAGIMPQWFAGISIGALNTAVLAGNPPQTRVARLCEFWETICQPAFFLPLDPLVERAWFNTNDAIRKAFSAWQAGETVAGGQRGFFFPRVPPPVPTVSTDPHLASYYDSAPLKATLERLCDFDRINSGESRVSVAAVNVRTGNFEYFDNTTQRLRAEHFMASGALPPALPAVEIDGEFYWDGGLMSNTPLSRVLEASPRRNTLAFQVDLWSARGSVPDNLLDVAGRQKDIQYSSRTRLVTDMLQASQRARHLLREVLARVPADVRATDPWCKAAAVEAADKRYNVIQLIYRRKEYEGHYKDYQFGLSIMHGHWKSGRDDIRRTLAHRDWLALPENDSGFVSHDIHREKPS